MRQDTPCVTAPKDPTPKWPDGFVTVLRNAGAKEKNIPYCIGWVQRFFSKYPGRAEDGLGRIEIEVFLSEIAAHPGINNWQVQQARNALELYYEKFRGIALSPRDAIPSDDITHPNHVGSETPPRDPASKNSCQNKNPNTKGVYTHPAENVNREILENIISDKPLDKPDKQRDHGMNLAPAEELPIRVPAVGDNSTGRCNWKILEERLKEVLRIEHYSYATEKTYIAWIGRYVAFHGWRKPSTLEAPDVRAFLKHLAMDEQVAASTQNQALNAVVFLYRKVI